MDIMMMLATEPTGFWQSIIGWFEKGIHSYGWAIIIFTICLKLILSPLDFYQKYSMRKTQAQQALLQPELERINQKYGNNKELVNQKTMELYKKNKISPASGCLPMLLYFVSTIVIFFTLFGAMNNVSQIKIQNEYERLQNVYVTEYIQFKPQFESDLSQKITINLEGVEQEFNYTELSNYAKDKFNELKDQDGKYVVGEITYATADEFASAFVDSTLKTLAQEKVLESFTQNKEGWLWIKNVFRPDNYSASFPDYAEFTRSVEDLYKIKTTADEKEYYYKSIDETVGDNGYFYLVSSDTENASELNAEILSQAKLQGETDFNDITLSVRQNYSSWNGYFILVIIAGLSTLLGQLLANAGAKVKNKKGEEQKLTQPTNKIMLIVMPLIMVWFTWSYSSAFALYIITNSLMSVLITYLINLIVNKFDAKREQKELVKISLKDANQTRINKQINTSQIAHEDYRIQKKGKIIEEKPQKTSKNTKKSKKNEDKTENNSNGEGENE